MLAGSGKFLVVLSSLACLGVSAAGFAQTTVPPVIVTAPHAKYLTDPALREGMVAVQNAVAAQYFAACALGPRPEGYLTLAAALDRSAAAMRLTTVSGSSKAEVSDLVDRLARGSAFLRSDDDRQVGVRVAVAVLVDYGKDFPHSGWRPRRSSRGDPAVTELTAETTASFMAAYPG